MSQTQQPQTVLIDVRAIPKPQRHPLIFDAMQKLAVGSSLIVKNDHNPVPLRAQVEQFFGNQFAWSYLEEGPEIFQLQFTRLNAPSEGWGLPGARSGDIPVNLGDH